MKPNPMFPICPHHHQPMHYLANGKPCCKPQVAHLCQAEPHPKDCSCRDCRNARAAKALHGPIKELPTSVLRERLDKAKIDAVFQPHKEATASELTPPPSDPLGVPAVLLPCPFCGKLPIGICYDGQPAISIYVACDCGACGPKAKKGHLATGGMIAEAAIPSAFQEWNTRHQPATPPREPADWAIEKLREALAWIETIATQSNQVEIRNIAYNALANKPKAN